MRNVNDFEESIVSNAGTECFSKVFSEVVASENDLPQALSILDLVLFMLIVALAEYLKLQLLVIAH